MYQFLQAAKVNWQTTILGLLAAVGLAARALLYEFDSDPLTVPDWVSVGAMISIALGLTSARDARKSTEQSIKGS